MPDYFLSDVHLRHDRPERGLRLARLLDRLGPDDNLYVVGDLCDFWLASRQRRLDPLDCPGMAALAAFTRKGGRLILFAGNHDAWLRDSYRRTIGGEWVADSLRIVSHGLRIHLAHGHLLGARSLFKASLESRAFLRSFALVPTPLAELLQSRLDRSNDRHRNADERGHLEVYRRFAGTIAGEVELVVLGHLHKVIDDGPAAPRLIVLGNWHRRSSFLRIDDAGPVLHVAEDSATDALPGPGGCGIKTRPAGQ